MSIIGDDKVIWGYVTDSLMGDVRNTKLQYENIKL